MSYRRQEKSLEDVLSDMGRRIQALERQDLDRRGTHSFQGLRFGDYVLESTPSGGVQLRQTVAPFNVITLA